MGNYLPNCTLRPILCLVQHGASWSSGTSHSVRPARRVLTGCATVLQNLFILYTEGKRFCAGSDSFPDCSVIGMPDRPLTRYVTLMCKTQMVAGMHSKETRTRDPGSRMPEDRFWKGDANSGIIFGIIRVLFRCLLRSN